MSAIPRRTYPRPAGLLATRLLTRLSRGYRKPWIGIGCNWAEISVVIKNTSMKTILVVGLILGVLLVAGGYAGYRGYVSIRQARLVKQARTFLDQSNGRKALLTLQRALRYNPKDVEACRL